MTQRIRIDGELYEVEEVRTWGDLPELKMASGEEFIVAQDSETAGKAARDYWEDMAEHDPREFTCMVGEEVLIAWALGQSAGPGSTGVRSLSEWLDLWIDTPEEHWASYDGLERDVERCGKVSDELGFTPTVAYRCH